MGCVELAGRVRLQQQVQAARRQSMREGTREAGSEWQPVPGGQDSALADRRERCDLYSECDGKLRAGA